jgi:hypothetical protein
MTPRSVEPLQWWFGRGAITAGVPIARGPQANGGIAGHGKNGVF